MDVFSTNIQRGFILVTVLFFLLMIALMVLSLLNSTHLELRMSQNYGLASQQFWAAEAGLEIAERSLAENSSAKHVHDAFNYTGYHVQYDAERIGLPFCSDQKIGYYYRITARAKQAQQQALVLQTTYAKKINKKCAENEEKSIKEGRSSWRELNQY
ncbi:pilus assembly PilX family protein [Rickettsiella endosymbiont of Dermanyssus gallinae]|uniref:pilus assembly PilX family protein n=1 Tax=Rickettsiella endosymbiont of Dermanyssus gallinae TaxID=2856608 RepID=UPI001C52BCF1|nr:PilX N-terminal domain-containing pilus assembly protein [Rickettsiella endosymbiont of Dermanyssus gallinae]